MEATKLVIPAAAALAMMSGFFGVVLARAVWADDLKHAQHLRESWDRQRVSMDATIVALRSTIDIQERRIALMQGQQPR